MVWKGLHCCSVIENDSQQCYNIHGENVEYDLCFQHLDEEVLQCAIRVMKRPKFFPLKS